MSMSNGTTSDNGGNGRKFENSTNFGDADVAKSVCSMLSLAISFISMKSVKTKFH